MEAAEFDNIEDLSAVRYQQLYKMLLDAIPCSILFINRDMRILSANRNFLEKSLRSEASTIGYRLESVFPSTILEHMDITRRIRLVFDENKPTQGQRLTYRAPGVPLRIYYYSILPFSWERQVESAMLLMEDVTEQVRLSEDFRRLERHLASIVECASDVIVSTDMDGMIVTWNAAAEKISGFSHNQVRGRYFYEFCVKEVHDEVKEVFSNIESQRNSIMAEWDLITKGGAFVPVYWVCSALKESASREVGIVAVGRDLTERRKLEMQLLQSQKLAALGVMAGGIAHEIRNPLAICSSAAQFLLEDDVIDDFRKECAEKIHVGIQRASVIIENLLRFARPTTTTEASRVDLVHIIQESIALVANQAKIQKIDLVTRFSHEQILVSGIEGLLQQVIINILLNAINAMPKGGSLVTDTEVRGNEVLVHIADTGHGISQANIDKIFDPFYTTSTVGKGTGLGLSICYSIVKHHFGSIDVESQVGEGSRFTLKLPLL